MPPPVLQPPPLTPLVHFTATLSNCPATGSFAAIAYLSPASPPVLPPPSALPPVLPPPAALPNFATSFAVVARFRFSESLATTGPTDRSTDRPTCWLAGWLN
eukprot:gene9952-biopygen3451